jgi:predicted dehydrogenase
MTARLRVAVAGLGIGAEHVRSYRALPELFEMVAVCDPDAARAERVAKQFEVPRIVRDFDALLAEPGLDVVDVCTPPHHHFAHASRALEAGKHVVCEKPLVGSLAEVDVLADLERRSGRRLMPIFQYRFGAGLQKLVHLVGRGVAGRHYLTTIEIAWRRGLDYYGAAPWRGRWRTELGGILLTHAIHAHDMLTHVLGPLRSVFARTATRVNPVETEDCASLSLELADGSLASSAATLGSHREITRLRFCFERLTAESNPAPYVPQFEPWTLTPASPEVGAEIEAALAGFDPGPQWFPGQLARFHAALAAGTELPVTIADARAALELVTAAYHSAETGEAVTLPIGRSHPKYASWLPAAAGGPDRTPEPLG